MTSTDNATTPATASDIDNALSGATESAPTPKTAPEAAPAPTEGKKEKKEKKEKKAAEEKPGSPRATRASAAPFTQARLEGLRAAKKAAASVSAEERRPKLVLVDPDAVYIHEDGPLADPTRNKAPDDAFCANVEKYGVRTPVLAREAKTANTMPSIFAGRKRTLALRLTNKGKRSENRRLLPVYLYPSDLTDEEAQAIMVAENEQRSGYTTLALAAHVASLFFGPEGRQIDGEGNEIKPIRSYEEVGTIIGRPASAVKALLSLLDVSAPVRKAVERGVLPLTSAAQIAKLDKDEQAKALDTALKATESNTRKGTAGRISVKTAKKAKKAAKGEEVTEAPRRREVEALYSFAKKEGLLSDISAESVFRFVLYGETRGALRAAAEKLVKAAEKAEAEKGSDLGGKE